MAKIGRPGKIGPDSTVFFFFFSIGIIDQLVFNPLKCSVMTEHFNGLNTS